MLKINLCMIVKGDDEAKNLERCLDSVQKYVDGTYITVTSDYSPAIDKLCTKRKIHLSRFKWVDDFSKARNFNFSQAPQDSDYLMWLDADDIFVGGEHLREVARQAKEKGKDVVFFTYWYGCQFDGEPSLLSFKKVLMEQNRERLLRPGVTTWKKRLHETPVPVSGANNNYTAYAYDEKTQPIVVMHASLDKDIPTKLERNKRILEIELEEERASGNTDARTILYLMKIYADQSVEANWAKCIEMGNEYLEKSGWDEERGVCWEQMGLCYMKMGDFRKASTCLHQAIAEWAHQPLTYIRLAICYYNMQNFRSCEHWMNVASQLDLDNKGSNITDFQTTKELFAGLLVKLNYNYKKDTKKALDAAMMLYKEAPTEENKSTVLFLEDIYEMTEACKAVEQVAGYFERVGATEYVSKMIEAMPDSISSQPFAIKLLHKFTPARVWGDKEICYFANFGDKHFEKWDTSSLKDGIGGSETAVIELSREWTKLGYTVTVYGDPKSRGLQDGVNYLPWYYFNKDDEFNVFIQWRNAGLAGKIKAKKFYIDLHDIFSQIDYPADKLKFIDKVFVKSKYHRDLAPAIPDSKIVIISNGVIDDPK